MRHGPLLALAAVLLASCAAPAPAPTPVGPAEGGPFRMRITRSFSSVDPGGTLTVMFDTVIETADGRPFPRGKWFFEGPQVTEDFHLSPGGRTWSAGDYSGAASGWSPQGYFMLKEIPAGTRRIRRVAVDLPMDEILEGESEEFRLAEGTEVIRRIGTRSYEFEAADGGLSLFRYDSDGNLGDAEGTGEEEEEDEEEETEGPETGTEESEEEEDALPVDGFYNVTSRPIDHAWEITDARGRPFVAGAGMGVGVFVHDEYYKDPRAAGKTEYPLVVRWRVPRRWRATMQRFVFEDLAVPAPEPDPPPRDE